MSNVLSKMNNINDKINTIDTVINEEKNKYTQFISTYNSKSIILRISI